MKLRLRDRLPFVAVTVTFLDRTINLDNVILDTGSASTVFLADQVASIGLLPEPDDAIHRIRGVGGSEFVFAKRVERLVVGELEVNNFEIEIGAMHYGMDLHGIIGMDFLTQARAVIDLHLLEIRLSGS